MSHYEHAAGVSTRSHRQVRGARETCEREGRKYGTGRESQLGNCLGKETASGVEGVVQSTEQVIHVV